MRDLMLYGTIIGFLLGIGFSSLYSFESPHILLLFLIAIGLGGILFRRYTHSEVTQTLFLLVFILGGACGMLRMELEVTGEVVERFESALGSEVELEGEVVREPEYRERTTHLYVETEGELLLLTTSRMHEAGYGDRVSFSGILGRPEAFETDLGRSFDYEGYLHARGVNYMIPFAEVAVMSTESGHPLYEMLFTAKRAFMHNLEMAIPSPHGGLAEGLLLGVKQSLGASYEQVFQKTGITHIVVLSGYNIMLVSLFTMYVLSFFLPFRLRLLCGIIVIILFAMLVGLGATVLRASIMAGLMLVAQFTSRTYDVVRALLLALVVMLLFNPYLLVFDIGFQFSFVATLGLIILSPRLVRLFKKVPTFVGIREFLVATVAAQIFVTPLLLYHIGTFSAVSILVNVLVLPMVPLAMLLSFITGLAGFFSLQLSQLFGYAAYFSLAYILKIAERFASFEFSAFSVPAFPFIFVLLAYGGMLLVLFLQRGPIAENELQGWTIVEESVFRETLR